MPGGVSGLFHPDTNLHRGTAHMVDAGKKIKVPVHIGRMVHQNIIDGGGNHHRFGRKATYIGQCRILGQLIQNLQKQPEAQVALQGFIDHHKTATQMGIGTQCQSAGHRSIIRSHGQAFPGSAVVKSKGKNLDHGDASAIKLHNLPFSYNFV